MTMRVTQPDPVADSIGATISSPTEERTRPPCAGTRRHGEALLIDLGTGEAGGAVEEGISRTYPSTRAYAHASPHF